MSETYILRLRRISLESFCTDRGLPVVSDPGSFDPETENEWNAYHTGFVSGCQFQLTECRQMLGSVSRPSPSDIAIAQAMSLPDGT